MGRREMGSTGLVVSSICFGMTAIGNMLNSYGYDVDDERARETLRAVFAGPVNFLDTSRNYGCSEERIGAAIRERGGLPEGFVLSTKLDRDMATNRFDGAQARHSLEQSLKVLGIDRIPLLHLHDPEYAASLSEVTGPNGALAALFRMKEQGLAQAVGLGAGNVDVMLPLLRDWDFDAVITHNRYTLLNRNADELIDFAAGKGIAVLNAAPFGAGILASGSQAARRYVYQEPDKATLQQVRRIEEVCGRHGIPIAAAALQFSMRDERIASTICGISKPEWVAQTIAWAEQPIGAEAWNELMSLPFVREDPEAARDYVPD